MAEIIFEDFTEFVVKEIAKAKGPDRNPIMADFARRYIKRCEANGEYVPNMTTLESYGTHIRVALEDMYISRVAPNDLNRSHRPLAVIRAFPPASNKKEMRDLIKFVYTKAAARVKEQAAKSRSRKQ